MFCGAKNDRANRNFEAEHTRCIIECFADLRRLFRRNKSQKAWHVPQVGFLNLPVQTQQLFYKIQIYANGYEWISDIVLAREEEISHTIRLVLIKIR